MAKITSPFNFVPLSDIVYYPTWSDMISHDVPFEDGEDGVIELEITNKSPLYIGEGHKDGLPAHVMSGGQARYYIPGTTLKGCFRNVMEVLSYGKMEQYEDDSFGFRSFDTKVKDGYMDRVKNVKCGWLWKDYDCCYLEECVGGVQKISHNELKRRMGISSTHELTDEDVKKLNSSYPEIEVADSEISFSKNNKKTFVKHGTYKLVCTGQISRKTHEYLFSVECMDKIKVDSRVVKRFESVHKSTPAFQVKKDGKGYIREKYDNGEKIPVFFVNDNDGIVCLGLTSMLKYPYEYSIKDLVKKNYGSEWENFGQSIDMPQGIFGYTRKTDSLKGRVQIGNAFADGVVPDSALLKVTGVLGQPKASYYPLYLQQDGRTVVNYSTTQGTIAGRKRYRITKDFKTIPLSAGNDNDKIITTFNALPSDLKFRCKISVHNLRKVEIGALLSSITFNMTGGCYHNIGMGKAFGFGIIECTIKQLKGLKYSILEYVDSFDEQIAAFLHQNGRRLSSEEQLMKLSAIASPTHTVDEMQHMDFDACRMFTQETNASVLVESPKKISVRIDEDAALRNLMERHSDEVYRRVEVLAMENKWHEVKEIFDNLILELTSANMDTSSAKSLRDEYKKKESVYVAACEELERKRAEEQKDLEEKHRRAEIETAKAAKKEKGLSFLLECKVNTEELKISSLTQGVKRIEDFLNKNKGYVMTEADRESVHEWLCRLEIPAKKQDKKEFQDFSSRSWKYLSGLFSSANVWFEEVNGK